MADLSPCVWVSLSLAILSGCSSSSDAGGQVEDAGRDTDAVSADVADVAEVADGGGGDTTVASDAADTSAESDAGGLPLDCAWVRDAKNCYRTFVAAVDGCLGNTATPSTDVGTFDTARATCTYAGGRSVAFAVPASTAADPADRDFTISSGGKSCLRYVESATKGGFTITAAAGTLTFTSVGNALSVTCPDGARYAGDALAISKLCAGEVTTVAPGRRITSGSLQRFELVGMKDWAYACQP